MKRKPPVMNNIDDFINGAKDANIAQQAQPPKNSKNKDEEYIRQTYYITPVQIKALSLMSAFEDIDKSVLVRDFFDKCIPQQYVEQAVKSLEKERR